MSKNGAQTISACLVIYNEEKVIKQCLESIKDLVDEIIVVHDGQCTDRTLEIVKQYTDKIFVRDHLVLNEPHLVFAFDQAKCEWLLRMDADEFFDIADHDKLRKMLASSVAVDGYTLNWELWDGEKIVTFKGLQKSCFFRRKNFHYIGVSQEVGWVDGEMKKEEIVLHHRPNYNNVVGEAVMKKASKWVPIYAKSFFPELSTYACYNTTPDKWVNYAKKVRKHPVLYLLFYPLKTFLAQLKNGLLFSWVGCKVAFQHYIIYTWLYLQIWQLQRKVEPEKTVIGVLKKIGKVLYKYWMKFAHVLGTINGFIILFVFYFVIIGLYALVQKSIMLISRLVTREKKNEPTFWKQKMEKGDGLDHLKYQF